MHTVQTSFKSELFQMSIMKAELQVISVLEFGVRRAEGQGHSASFTQDYCFREHGLLLIFFSTF